MVLALKFQFLIENFKLFLSYNYNYLFVVVVLVLVLVDEMTFLLFIMLLSKLYCERIFIDIIVAIVK
jgi:hypothetical protein